MRRLIRLCACLTVFATFILQALVLQTFRQRTCRNDRERALLKAMQRTAQRLLYVLGIQVHRQSSIDIPRAALLSVSNHQSYLDVAIIAALFPTRFVAKQEIAAWPLIGLISRLCGTIYLNRTSLRDGVKCSRLIADSLSHGHNVHIFPEGTTTNGKGVLPFKPLLLNAAIKSQVPLLPLTINYTAINGAPLDDQTRDLCCWHSEMEFLGHFWKLLAQQTVEVKLEVHPMIKPNPNSSTQELTQQAHNRVSSGLLSESTSSNSKAETALNEQTSDEFLIGAFLFSLLTRGQDLIEESEYGQTR